LWTSTGRRWGATRGVRAEQSVCPRSLGSRVNEGRYACILLLIAAICSRIGIITRVHVATAAHHPGVVEAFAGGVDGDAEA
jgi:hypothetical protein